MPQPSPNRRTQMAEARRQAILAAAKDEFVAKGFAAARVEDIAKRAGVAKGTVYLHFPDKEQLFGEVISAHMVPITERIRGSLAAGGVSLRALEASEVLNSSLGAFVPAYLKLKHQDWNDYARHLTAWERDTTLDC